MSRWNEFVVFIFVLLMPFLWATATLLSCVRLFANCSLVCSFGVASYPIMVSVYGWNVAMMLLSSCKAYLWPKEAIMQTQHIIDFCCTQYTCAIKCTHKLNPRKTSAPAPAMVPVPPPDRHRQCRSLAYWMRNGCTNVRVRATDGRSLQTRYQRNMK